MDLIATALPDFLEALTDVSPDATTNCHGWTVHDLTAHLSAGSAEIADLAEESYLGAPPRPTRSFDEREVPFRALDGLALRERFVDEAGRALAAILQLDTDRRVEFTGTVMTPSTLLFHGLSELVIHRWDITGDDDVSWRDLGRPEMTHHLMSTVAATDPAVVPFRLRARPQDATLVLGAPGMDDVVLAGERPEELWVEFPDPSARLLALWGRRPTDVSLRMVRGDAIAVATVARRLGLDAETTTLVARVSPAPPRNA